MRNVMQDRDGERKMWRGEERNGGRMGSIGGEK